jgi:hypothetical protein
MAGGGVALALAVAGVAYAAGSLHASGDEQAARPRTSVQVEEVPTVAGPGDAGSTSGHAHAATAAPSLEEPRGTDGPAASVSASEAHGDSSYSLDNEMPGRGAMLASDDRGAGEVVTFDGKAPKAHHPPVKPTAEELACLAALTAQAKEATLRLQDPAVAAAEGYRFNDDPTDTHMPNPAYHRDGTVLDLGHPESAIYRLRDNGKYQLVGVLYKAVKGQGQQPCGNATWWHTHTHCRADASGKPLDMLGDQPCPAGSTAHEGRVEMMHLWFVPRGQRR